MLKLYGIQVSNGIAIGKARFLEEKEVLVSEQRITIQEIPEHLERFRKCLEFLMQDIDHYLQNFSISPEDEAIIETHKMIINDPEFHLRVEYLIQHEQKNIEHAIYTHFTKTINYFKTLENELYADRAIDYEDVLHRLLDYLQNTEDNSFAELETSEILVSNDLSPSKVTLLMNKKIAGIILFKGSKTSHSVIIARACNIPIITGVKAKHKIHTGDNLILDASNGYVFIQPTEELQHYYLQQLQENIQKTIHLAKFKEQNSCTGDYEQLQIFANIELPLEINKVMEVNADGIGLFRTEFFYMNRNTPPKEEEQFLEYQKIASELKGKPFVIRTIDMGGDKIGGWYSPNREENPSLGCRGIRFSLQNKKIFIPQLRAILRASAYGKIALMFPMVSGVEEFIEAKNQVILCQQALKKENIRFDRQIKIGTMIEIPSAALGSATLAKYCDFFSIGTNDLLQYTIAIDRNNEKLATQYNPYNPAFLQLVLLTIKNAKKHRIPITICGEIASDPNFIPFLLSAGVRQLSMNVEHILSIKKLVRSIEAKKTASFVDELKKCSTTRETEILLKKISNLGVVDLNFT